MSADNLSFLSNHPDILCGAPLRDTEYRLYKMSLKTEKFPDLPDDYWQVMGQINGLSYNGAQIYGISPTVRAFKDMRDVNQKIKHPSLLFLGESADDWLVYDSEDGEFKIMDKYDNLIWKHTPSFALALRHLLQI